MKTQITFSSNWFNTTLCIGSFKCEYSIYPDFKLYRLINHIRHINHLENYVRVFTNEMPGFSALYAYVTKHGYTYAN